jgi:hypothetical protein
MEVIQKSYNIYNYNDIIKEQWLKNQAIIAIREKVIKERLKLEITSKNIKNKLICLGFMNPTIEYYIDRNLDGDAMFNCSDLNFDVFFNAYKNKITLTKREIKAIKYARTCKAPAGKFTKYGWCYVHKYWFDYRENPYYFNCKYKRVDKLIINSFKKLSIFLNQIVRELDKEIFRTIQNVYKHNLQDEKILEKIKANNYKFIEKKIDGISNKYICLLEENRKSERFISLL